MKGKSEIKRQLDCQRSEKYLERKLAEQAKRMGCVPLKFSSSIQTGFPDRMILLPSGHTIWVEVKSAGKKLRAIQKAAKQKLEELGHEMYVVDSTESLKTVLQIIKSRLEHD